MDKSKYRRILTALAPLFNWLLVIGLPFLSRMGDPTAQLRNDWMKNMFFSDVLLIVLFYIHSYLIYPLTEKKNGIYIYSVLLLASLALFITINHHFHPEMPRFRRPDIRPPNALMGILPFTFVILVSVSYRIYMDKVNRENHIKELENIHLKTELEFLSSQISPHFMFNVLNTLVFMARKKSELIEPSLISLSQLMRYMLYENDGGRITLAAETEYLKNYINLQLLRFGDDISINLYISGDFEKYVIEPMLLIPFVENAFKHGIGTLEHPIIDVSITVDELKHELELMVMNEIPVEGTEPMASSKNSSGIGLANVRRRLELLYPEQHVLQLEKKDDTFTARLQINL